MRKGFARCHPVVNGRAPALPPFLSQMGADSEALMARRVRSLTRICSCPFLHESGESSLSSARHTPIWHFTTSWTWNRKDLLGLRPP